MGVVVEEENAKNCERLNALRRRGTLRMHRMGTCQAWRCLCLPRYLRLSSFADFIERDSSTSKKIRILQVIQTHKHFIIIFWIELCYGTKRKPDRLKKKPMTRVWCGNRDLPSRYTGTRGTDNRQPVRIIIRPLRSLFHNHDQDATTDLPRKFETEEFSWTGILEDSQILKESIDVFGAQLFGK